LEDNRSLQKSCVDEELNKSIEPSKVLKKKDTFKEGIRK
jgi:hypothetical protein